MARDGTYPESRIHEPLQVVIDLVFEEDLKKQKLILQPISLMNKNAKYCWNAKIIKFCREIRN